MPLKPTQSPAQPAGLNTWNPSVSWLRLLLVTFLAAYFYGFMEWLFFVTKPSFMDVLSDGNKLEILLLTCLAFWGVGLLAFLFFFVLSRMPFLSRFQKVLGWGAAAAPAVFWAVTFFLWLDNFTYTVLKFGIVTSQGAWRGVYGLVFLALLAVCFRAVVNYVSKAPTGVWFKIYSLACLAVAVVSVVLFLIRLGTPDTTGTLETVQKAVKKPNIILLGSDGVNANDLSAYGYERNTTPYLKQLSKTSLFAENAYPNAGNTSGSVISILTGKPATQTRLIYPPDILRGADAYQHLPGILRQLGYHTVEISFPHYVDAYALNMREGFDIVNERSIGEHVFFRYARQLHLEDVGYFAASLIERLSDRLLHVFYVRVMPDPYHTVLEPTEKLDDKTRIDQLVSLFSQTDRPFFVHVHMMGTHGPAYNPSQQNYSAGKALKAWDTDYYDDAIHEFDQYVGVVLNELENAGILDNTILIIYTDHAQKFVTTNRIPLMMRFPNAEYAQHYKASVQNLDIAPTVLDYMGVSIPSWMGGQSLLRGEPDAQRPIYAAGGSTGVAVGEWRVNSAEKIQPPFYQFVYFSATVCQNWVKYDVRTQSWTNGEMPGHTAPCSAGQTASLDEMKKGLVDYLKAQKFDVSSIRINQ